MVLVMAFCGLDVFLELLKGSCYCTVTLACRALGRLVYTPESAPNLSLAHQNPKPNA